MSAAELQNALVMISQAARIGRMAVLHYHDPAGTRLPVLCGFNVNKDSIEVIPITRLDTNLTELIPDGEEHEEFTRYILDTANQIMNRVMDVLKGMLPDPESEGQEGGPEEKPRTNPGSIQSTLNDLIQDDDQ